MCLNRPQWHLGEYIRVWMVLRVFDGRDRRHTFLGKRTDTLKTNPELRSGNLLQVKAVPALTAGCSVRA